jgi:hypothetical protein
MDSAQELWNRIATARARLYRAVVRADSLTGPEVLALSSELDRLILAYMRLYPQRERQQAGR